MADLVNDKTLDNLTELLSNTVNMTSVFYDIFLNPQPMDVTLQQYDTQGNIITISIPNRAKDRQIALSGEGSPEGVVSANVGASYVDETNLAVYFKAAGDGTNVGWVIVSDQSSINAFMRNYLESNGYVTKDDIGRFLESDLNNALQQIDTARVDAIKGVDKKGIDTIIEVDNEGDTQVQRVTTAGTEQVNLAKEQAMIATTKAEEATEAVNNATEQANIATQKVQEIIDFNPAKVDLSNLTEEGLKVIKDNSGSGLEICDIGMALYVDETKGLRRYLNGQIVDINTNTQAFLDRLKQIAALYPSLLCTENEWQTAKTMSAFGQVGKFVFNYADDGVTVVSVRIPRVVNIQGVFDLQNLGLTVTEKLPNIQGKFDVYYRVQGASGAFAPYGTGGNGQLTGGHGYAGADFYASRSSSVYQDGAHVQQEAIQYPYFIQIATGAETKNNIVNDIELNNPYSLFDSKYSDHKLNNLSWLKSEGQWNAKAVYPTAYDELLKVYNGIETVVGLSVKLSTEEYTDYDFVLNTADETFRLPLLDGSESIPSAEKHVYTLPTSSGQQYTALYNGIIQLNAASSAANQYVSLSNIITGEYSEMRTPLSGTSNICNIQVKAGDTFTVNGDNISTINWLANIKYIGNGSLYYYVGETVQNANLVDAGRIGEQLADKVDLDAQNLSTEGKEFICGLSIPISVNQVDIAIPADGTFITADKDCLLNMVTQMTSSIGRIEFTVYDTDGNIINQVLTPSTANNYYIAVWTLLPKGCRCKIGYNGIDTSKGLIRKRYLRGNI